MSNLPPSLRHLNTDPKQLRLNRVKSAYQFSANSSGSKFTRRLSEVYSEQLDRQKQKFLLAQNISDKEYEDLGGGNDGDGSRSSGNTRTRNKEVSIKTKDSPSLEMADYLLIQNENKRVVTLQMNEITNIDYVRQKKHLTLEYKMKFQKIDREMKEMQKYLQKLQNYKTQESKEITSLKRRCKNQRALLDQSRARSELSFKRRQTIAANNTLGLSKIESMTSTSVGDGFGGREEDYGMTVRPKSAFAILTRSRKSTLGFWGKIWENLNFFIF